MTKPQFIIWTHPWNETGGGDIALHSLCHRLNLLGFSAALWPSNRLRRHGLSPLRFAREKLRYWLSGGWRFDRGPLDNPIARVRDLQGAVVVYPEVVAGNPLGATRVARWFLHRPGYHTGRAEFGGGELSFYYVPAFNDPAYGLGSDRWLRVTYINPSYRQTNFGAREGACYIVRKGAGRTLDRHPADAIKVDDLSHREKADVFNRTRFFYSYDAYTLYTLYAALCGCVSIFLPEDGVSLEAWSPAERPPGLAYGIDDLAFAEATRVDLVEKVKRDLREEDDMIRRFADACLRHFSAGTVASAGSSPPA